MQAPKACDLPTTCHANHAHWQHGREFILAGSHGDWSSCRWRDRLPVKVSVSLWRCVQGGATRSHSVPTWLWLAQGLRIRLSAAVQQRGCTDTGMKMCIMKEFDRPQWYLLVCAGFVSRWSRSWGIENVLVPWYVAHTLASTCMRTLQLGGVLELAHQMCAGHVCDFGLL